MTSTAKNHTKERVRREGVAPCRFELQSQDPESRMIDHYTMGLSIGLLRPGFNNFRNTVW